jgi:tetratricopeptide (TPR) repeat protein
LNNLGYALAGRKEYDRAIEYYQQALAAAPRFAESLNNLGCAYLGKKEYTLAVEQFRAALEIKAEYALTLNNLGTALHELGDFTNAIACYERAVAAEPTYDEAFCNLANSLCAAGRVTNALVHYQRAIELRPGFANARLNYGVELFKLRRLPEAEEQLTRSLAAGTNSSPHFWLAAIAREKSDTNEITHLRAFLAADPGHARARTQLAMALAGQQQFAAALTEARETVRRQPAYAPAHYCLGALLEQAGQPSEAIGAYEQALRCQADYPEALNNLAWLLVVNADDSLRNGARAVELATRACELTHYEVPMFIGTLAAAQAEAGQFTAAVATAERAARTAEAAGDHDLAGKNRQSQEWYRAGRTWREGEAQRPR